MGVHIGQADGDCVTLLRCRNCRTEYEIDETTWNDCPDCGEISYLVYSTDYDAPWRSAR